MRPIIPTNIVMITASPPGTPACETARARSRMRGATLAQPKIRRRGPRRAIIEEGPQRPAQLVALDQRVDQQRGATVTSTTPTGSSRTGVAGQPQPRQVAEGCDGRDHADRDIDEEDHPPAGAEQVAWSSTPAMTGPSTADSPIIGPNMVNALADSSGGKAASDQGQPLRDHHRAEETLHDAEPMSIPGDIDRPQRGTRW